MVEEVDNHTLVILRKIDEKVNGIDTKMDHGVQRRVDRMEDRLDHVERRLDLVGSAPGFAE